MHQKQFWPHLCVDVQPFSLLKSAVNSTCHAPTYHFVPATSIGFHQCIRTSIAVLARLSLLSCSFPSNRNRGILLLHQLPWLPSCLAFASNERCLLVLQVPAVMKGKRAAAAATTPQVVKKVKLADGKAPASAPAKASSQPSAGLFLVLVKAFLKPPL